VRIDPTPYVKTLEELKPYFLRWEEILADFLREWLAGGGPPVRLLVFGSILSGKAHPALSDIDVLVLAPEGVDLRELRRRWLAAFRRRHFFHPFEFHFADPDLFENWYSRFVKEWREIGAREAEGDEKPGHAD